MVPTTLTTIEDLAIMDRTLRHVPPYSIIVEQGYEGEFVDDEKQGRWRHSV